MKVQSGSGLKADGVRDTVHLESNSDYWIPFIIKYLLLALATSLILHMIHRPGWAAWPIANVYILWKLFRERAARIELSTAWNALLGDWLNHERRLHKQQREEQRRAEGE